MNISKTIGILQNIMNEITPIIPFPVRLYVNSDDVFLEVIIGEERIESGKENDSICFGFNDGYKGKYEYVIYPDAAEYGIYRGKDYSIEALAEYTIYMINSCTCKVC